MNTLHIGIAKKEITPQKPVEMCGYGPWLNRVFKGIDDSLYARSIAFVQGERRYLIVNCDLEGIDAKYYRKIKDGISDRLRLSPDDMLLSVIHTHSGPAFYNLGAGAGQPDKECVEEISDIIIECACEAFNTLREVTGAKVCTCQVPDLSIERTGSQAPINQTMHALTFTFDSGKPLALLNFGCHPVAADINDRITADWPGAAVRGMEALGYDALCLVAFCGNINPPKKGEGCVEKGAKLAEYYTEAMKTAQELTDLTIKTASFDESYKLRIMPEEESAPYIEIYKHLERYPTYAIGLHNWEKIIADFREGRRPPLDLVHVRFLSIGDVLIAGFSAEMVSDLSFIIEKAFPEYTVFTMGNLFDTRRYLASERLIDCDTYEARASCIGYCTIPIVKGEAERVVSDACEKAKKLLM